MSRAQEATNRSMLRARDTIDREYATDLDIAALADAAHLSPDHLIRTFRSVFGETPHRYLQRRRIERAMTLLRTSDQDVTEVCMGVGFSSLGTFSRLFTEIVGQSPSSYADQNRQSRKGSQPAAPGCFTMAWTRPSSFTHVRRPASTGASISEKPREVSGG